MNFLERIAGEIEEKIEKTSEVKVIRPSIVFCDYNPQGKKDIYKRVKRLGLSPTYSIKNATIKVKLRNNTKIETDKYKTISMNYKHFDFIYRYLKN
tara:strand:+ start:271 stop:558 length:288 start_codon:yes stop_codon:yes gene_type:complete